MQKIATFCLSVVFLLSILSQAQAQGCVAIRQMGGCSGVSGSALLGKGQLQVGANYRYFRSFRHFKGAEEQTIRLEQHTEVINHSHALDLNVNYGISNRLSVNAAIPLAFNDRSSLYEHDKVNRYHTQSHGLADIRVGASYWLLNPDKFRKGNIAFGMGVKIPTGNYKVTDEFHSGENGALQSKPVDQSIQLGDGGWGVSAELQGFVQIFRSIGLYGSAFYLVNPRDSNSVSTGRRLPAPNSSLINMSVPDQFLTRLGVSWITPFQHVQFSLGGRFEGVTVYDLIGGSNGFRRPGYVVAVEPGLAWFSHNVGVTFTMPYALVRNRTQSYTDKLSEQIDVTDKTYHGDAAFADYSLNAGIVWRFNGKHAMAVPVVPTWNDVKK